ncbi:hypothetical protein DERP_007529 [Dermatophagoides pteronyssinus]|uniref:C2H2-type domain-containing protein n=1 Tax=Dermatophagoides pteronyssinus TaxID=6956 RepID=A0ABQ8J4R1_DERPT|nr:hypothetical protein DERP_007529 [Dermatophagoides pteronyssinus]
MAQRQSLFGNCSTIPENSNPNITFKQLISDELHQTEQDDSPLWQQFKDQMQRKDFQSELTRHDVSQLQNKIDTLECKLFTLELENDGLKTCKQESIRLKSEISEKNEQLFGVRRMLEAAETNLDSLRRSNAMKDEQINELMQKIASLQSQSESCRLISNGNGDDVISPTTAKKPLSFACCRCDATFKTKYHLQRHCMRHSNKRPFKCSVCKEKFKRRDVLERHSLRHSDKRPFKCSECDATFKRQDVLKQHHQNEHL